MKITTAIILFITIPGLFAYEKSPFIDATSPAVLDAFYRNNSRLFRRAFDGTTTCDNTVPSSVFTRFNGIFFGDFTTTGGKASMGPLAIQGEMNSNNYEINADSGVNSCDDLEYSFDGYGLVVGGNYDNSYANTVVGAAFLPPVTDTSLITQLASQCPILTARGTGLFDFTQAYTNAVSTSRLFSAYFPTIVLRSTSLLNRITPQRGDFDFATMDTCNGIICGLFPGIYSDPSRVLFGRGAWNGPIGMSWPSNLVINIPVGIGRTLTISTNNPSLGMNVCGTIFNIYPATPDGSYQSGRIYIDRETSGMLGGFILAPEADIIDSNRGNFAGLVVANNYRWSGQGAELRDYAAAGGNCPNGFTGCFPIYNNTSPIFPGGPSTRIPTSSSTSEIFSTIYSESSTTITYSTITDEPSSTITFSTITDEPSSTITFSTITEGPSSTETFSTITEEPSFTETFSTITEESSSSETFETVGSVITVTVTPTETPTYSTITTITTPTSNDETDDLSIVTGTLPITVTFSTITVVTASTLFPASSRSRSSSGFTNTISASTLVPASSRSSSGFTTTISASTLVPASSSSSGFTITISASTLFPASSKSSDCTVYPTYSGSDIDTQISSNDCATIYPEADYIYCTYGGNPHFHKDKLFEHYEHEEYEDIPGLRFNKKPWYIDYEEYENYKAEDEFDSYDQYYNEYHNEYHNGYYNEKNHLKHKKHNNYVNGRKEKH